MHSSRISRLLAATLGAAVLAAAVGLAQAPPAVPLITGPFNIELTVADREASVAFYRDVLGFEAAPARRGGPPPAGAAAPAPPAATAPAPPSAPAVPAGGGAAGAGRLTGAIGGAPRISRMSVPGASWQLEIIEMTGIERQAVHPRRQDVGTSGLILFVRDIDQTLAALRKAQATILTVGGQPMATSAKGSRSRSVVAQDPDGFILDIRQMDPVPQTAAPATSNIVDVGMTVSVRNIDETVRYWHDVLDFASTADAGFNSDKTSLALMGTPGAQVRKAIVTHPGSPRVWEFLEFKGIERKELMPRIQDPGNAALIVLTQDMEALVRRLHASPLTKILSVGGDYVPRGTNGGAIFFQDMNGFILEGCKGC